MSLLSLVGGLGVDGFGIGRVGAGKRRIEEDEDEMGDVVPKNPKLVQSSLSFKGKRKV